MRRFRAVAAFQRVDFEYVLKVGALAQRLGALGYLRTMGRWGGVDRVGTASVASFSTSSLLAGSLKCNGFRFTAVLATAQLLLLGPLVLHCRLRKYRGIVPASVARAVFDDRKGTIIDENGANPDRSTLPSKSLS